VSDVIEDIHKTIGCCSSREHHYTPGRTAVHWKRRVEHWKDCLSWQSETQQLEKQCCCLVRIHVSRSLSRALASWKYKNALAKCPFWERKHFHHLPSGSLDSRRGYCSEMTLGDLEEATIFIAMRITFPANVELG